MGRAKLPEARIEPRGVDGHLAKLRAEAREGTRVAGVVGMKIARILGWTAFAGGAVAVLVMIAPPPRSPELDELRRIQADFHRQQLNLQETQRALDAWQAQVNVPQVDLRSIQLAPVAPPYPSYDWTRVAPPSPITLPPLPGSDTPARTRAAKEAHAVERAQAIETKRAQRGN